MKTAALDELAAELFAGVKAVAGPPGLLAATEDLRVPRDAVYADPDEDATRGQHERGEPAGHEPLEPLFDEGIRPTWRRVRT